MENNHKIKITQNSEEAFYFDACNIPYVVYLNEKNKEESFPNGAYCVESLDDIDDKYMERIYRRFKDIPWDIAETKRLKLREITVLDVPRLYELYADESITRYMEPLFPEMQQEVEYTKGYIRNIYKFYGYGMWVIEEKESGLLIGRAGLEYKEGFDGLELGFMLGVDYQHKGYAYEACTAALKYGTEELLQTRYCAFVNENNEASIRLCERLGFIKSGVADDRGLIQFVKD
jgi:RimJ/RimL family protein N-acetyltransferase